MKITIPSFILLLLLTAFIQQNPIIITGTVLSQSGQPMQGVVVNWKGHSASVVTDSTGKYQLAVNSKGSVLNFSLIGYESKEVAIGKKNKIDVVLQAASSSLDEVIVTGYQPRRKSDVTGSVSTLNSKDMSSPATALAGRASGVFIRGTAGVSGAGYTNNTLQASGYISYNTESYSHTQENNFMKAADNPLSTFSIDVDAASYSNVRRFITSNQRPPVDAVRTEEMINYFTYQYPQPAGEHPFTVTSEITACPWNKGHRLALIGLQGKKVDEEQLPASNLVFLVDVSGSMSDYNKLPLVKSSLELLTDKLRGQDRVAIVTYAGNAGLVLPSTGGDNKLDIKEAIRKMDAGGSTAGGAGIQLAYKVAKDNFIKGGNNRVILCTDGDFNVGVSSEGDLTQLIEKERDGGVFLTVLGYGTGNYQDSKMQQLADKGNGNHAYIDGISEAQKVLVHEFGGTLFTIAKDVKLQVEFNPAQVKGYRLIGYENRMLNKEDFNNDKKDAGELGSGHTVTALYELIPAGADSPELDSVDKLRYQQVPAVAAAAPATKGGNEAFFVKVRYKAPDGDKSRLFEMPVADTRSAWSDASENLRFAAAVAAFGMKLGNSRYCGSISYDDIIRMGEKALGADKEHYRKEFVQLVKKVNKMGEPEDDGE